MDDTDSYFEASWLDNREPGRAARPVDQEEGLVHRFRKPGSIDDLPELVWMWENTTHSPGDVVFAVNGIRLVSPLVRQIFDQYRGVNDVIQWLPGVIVLPSGERLPHWIPHFPSPPDIIDRTHSEFGPSGRPIRYSLNREKLSGHAVTIIAGTAFKYVLSRTVVDALESAGARGVMIIPVRVV